MAKHQNYTTIMAVLTALTLLAVPIHVYAQQGITVTLDKQEYSTGDTLMVSGKVPRVITGLDVIIQIINPKNAQAALAQVTPDANGNFMKEFKLGGTLMKESGTYKVRVTYGELQQEASFTLTAQAQPQARQFNVRISGIQENITLSGTISNGNVTSITVDQDFNSLVFNLSNVTADSKISVTIPSSILQEPNRFNEVEFIVLADGEEVDAQVSTQGNNRIVTFTVPAGTEEVEIVVVPENIRVVPEFGVIAALILALSIGTLIALSRKQILNIPLR
jgi:predicted secreted protein with PEFG-CTERM motif